MSSKQNKNEISLNFLLNNTSSKCSRLFTILFKRKLDKNPGKFVLKRVMSGIKHLNIKDNIILLERVSFSTKL